MPRLKALFEPQDHRENRECYEQGKNRIAQSYDYIEATESTWIFGTPSPAVLEMVNQFRQAAGQEETLNVLSQPLSGFTRLGPG